MWSSLRKIDKAKLIYAYVVTPLFLFMFISGNISSELYHIHGSKTALNTPFWLVLRLVILGYLPLILPPTVIRFIIPRRELRYGIEIYCYMLLSMFLTRVLSVIMMGKLISTLGLLDTLVLYCILSYKTTDYSEIPRLYRYILTFLTLGAIFILPYFSNNKHYIFPIYEALVLCIVLNTLKNDVRAVDEATSASSSSSQYQEVSREPSDIVTRLVDTGLAHIGRITPTANPYLTPEQTEERHKVERPFLKLLSDRYRAEVDRKVLSQYFMIYKEMTLFIIYAMVLKSERMLHAQVRTKLKESLFRRVIRRREEEA